MPIYEYRCLHCGHCFEKLSQSVNQKKIKCEVCGKGAEKIISQVGIVFKGSGFHTTDYKSKSKASPDKSVKTEDKSAASSLTTKKED